MLKPPKLGGAGQLRLFVETIGTAAACEILDVHPTTMRRWLRGAVEPPRAVLHALYWLTPWGFSDACAEAHWSHAFLLGKVADLETALAAARREKSRRRTGFPIFEQRRRHRWPTAAAQRFDFALTMRPPLA